MTNQKDWPPDRWQDSPDGWCQGRIFPVW